MNYFWIRVFDYDFERDGNDKGTLLDEFYLKDIETREEAKDVVRTRCGNGKLSFAKPKKMTSGVYAIILDSNKFFYDRFYTTIDTYCFLCHRPIKGSARDFPRTHTVSHPMGGDEFGPDTMYFDTHDCKRQYDHAIHPMSEGEFQEKQAGEDGNVFGYIYHIYNRVANRHYVGQTRFMPFFRWQEHVKDGAKGDITELVFTVLAEVRKKHGASEEENQQYLNSIEAWWINKYIEEGYDVANVTKPKITVASLKQAFDEMVAREKQLALFEE